MICRQWIIIALAFSAIPLMLGCATWLPSGEQPPTISNGIQKAGLSSESVAIETFLLRLTPEQAENLPDLWLRCDEQILTPEKRILLDKNGLRVGKVFGNLPPILESWVQATQKRMEDDPLEQTGLAADVISVARQWRCRADSIKTVLIRNLETSHVTLFYHDSAAKGKRLDAPKFTFTLTAIPGDNSTADVRLTPEVEYGNYINRLIVRDAALRSVSQRESIVFHDLAMKMRLQRGDCLVIGPTSDCRGLGAEFFHSQTQNMDTEPVLLLVRLAQSGVDSVFAPEDAKKAKSTASGLVGRAE